MKKTDETKEERFVRLAEKRAAAAIRRIRMVGATGNRAGYAYNKRQVEALFARLEDEVQAARRKFDAQSRSLDPAPIGLGEIGGTA